MEIAEMLENIQKASPTSKGYKFHCANVPRKCEECGKKLVSFITLDIDEAYQHSLANSVAIWINKD